MHAGGKVWEGYHSNRLDLQKRARKRISAFSAMLLPSQAWTPAVARSQSAKRAMALNPEPRNAMFPAIRQKCCAFPLRRRTVSFALHSGIIMAYGMWPLCRLSFLII